MSIEADARMDLTNAYTEQVRADLERVDGEIAQLEARLRSLHADRVLLGKLWENLSSVATEAAAPVQSRRGSAATGHSSQESSAPAPASAGGTRGRPAKRGSVRAAVLRRLRASDGPMSVNDMFEALPSAVRASGKVVVRNTLEALVARGIAERSRRGQSVRYTFIDIPPGDEQA
ncbi:hypothetical protein [Streptomyces sp. NPDC005731]|uniref:hypothetical protein n=1 Tax=unclassified Streptomyces TaxID=2593676 RepID=UPI0033E98B90